MSVRPARKSRKVANNRKESRTWKKSSKSSGGLKKFKKVAFRYFVIFSIFFTSILGITSYIIYKRISAPFASAYSSEYISSEADIRSGDMFSVLLLAVDTDNSVKEAKYMLFDVKNKKIVSYAIPADVTFDVSGKYDYEPMSKLLALGLSISENDLGQAMFITQKSIENTFAYNIDKYVVLRDTAIYTKVDSLLQGKMEMSLIELDFWKKLRNQMSSDMTFSEFYYVYKFALSVTPDNYINSTIEANQDYAAIDSVISDMTFDSAVSVEENSIAVLNGTNVGGVANFGARAIRNMGGRVTSINNASKVYDQSYLIVTDPQSATVHEISDFFSIPAENIHSKEDSFTHNLSELDVDRADVTLIIGVDIVNSL